MMLFLVSPLFLLDHTEAGVFKWIRVGKYQTKIVDSGDQGEQAGEGQAESAPGATVEAQDLGTFVQCDIVK